MMNTRVTVVCAFIYVAMDVLQNAATYYAAGSIWLALLGLILFAFWANGIVQVIRHGVR